MWANNLQTVLKILSLPPISENVTFGLVTNIDFIFFAVENCPLSFSFSLCRFLVDSINGCFVISLTS